MQRSSFRILPRAGILASAGALLLAIPSHAQTLPTEPPPTPAPTEAPTTPIPTITVPVLALLPVLQQGDEVTLAVALPPDALVFLESSIDLSTWVNDSASVPASGLAVLNLEKVPGEAHRFYRLREQP